MNDIKKRSEEDDKAIRSTKEKGESKIRQNLNIFKNKNTKDENKILYEENQKLKQKIIELIIINEIIFKKIFKKIKKIFIFKTKKIKKMKML